MKEKRDKENAKRENSNERKGVKRFMERGKR